MSKVEVVPSCYLCLSISMTRFKLYYLKMFVHEMSLFEKFTFVIFAMMFCGIKTDCFLVPDGLQRVVTQRGEIHGIQINGVFDGQTYVVNKFLGIPFAEPPVGHLRFKKPERLRHFPSPLKAVSHGPFCIKQYNLLNKSMSEDCLTLNVYAPFPHGADVLRKPVMIWIYGGGFVVGSSGDYNPEVLSAFSDVIVVTLNYRLGALGFLSTSDGESPGNYGLWDQQLAIQWVHENIASFGGDPDNITIFGESAGASSVIFQTLYAGNKGLFKRAIAESGTLSTWAVTDNDSVYEASIDFANTLGCTDTNHTSLMACMRLTPSTDIIKAVQEYNISFELHQSWIPVYDKDFVIEEPLHMLANANSGSQLYAFFHEVDIMIGWNNYDGCLYFRNWMSKFNITSLKDFAVTADQLDNVLVPLIAELGLATPPIPEIVGKIRQEYTQTASQMTADDRVELLGTMATDAFLAAPTTRTARAHANTTSSSSTYIYRFSAKPPFRIAELPPYLDRDDIANHSDELMFVFGMKPVTSAAARHRVVPKPTQRQIRLSKAVMTLWSNFAKSGNPNKPRNVKQFYNIEWEKYELDQPRHLEITTDMIPNSTRSGPSSPAIDFWINLLPRNQTAPQQ